MSKIAHSVEDLIGHTPLLALERYGTRHGFSAQVLAKLEYLNPAGSATRAQIATILMRFCEGVGK